MTELNTPPHVFLGGSCGAIKPDVFNWRRDLAIPRLQSEGITYYNPQVEEGHWNPGLISIEATAKEGAPQLLIVIDGTTRGGASLLEAMEYVCYGSFVHLVIDDIPDGQVIRGQRITGFELEDLNRPRAYLRSRVTVRRPHLKVWPTVSDALDAIVVIAGAYR
jgi:hypothetical protein